MAAGAHMLRFTTAVDDAFISFRVAKHWVEYGLPLYNPGIVEWVPTNFLWVSILAGMHGVLPWSMPTLAQILGGICGLITIILLLTTFPGFEARRLSIYAALFCAGSAAWASWPLSGMETTFFALALLAGVRWFIHYHDSGRLRDIVLAGLAWGLATLIRPEGAFFFGVSFLFLGMASRNWRHLGWFSLVFVFLVLLQVIYLVVVFGSVLPNSYYTKMQGLSNLGRGGEHLLHIIKIYHLGYFLPLMIVPAFSAQWRKLTAYLGLLILIWAGWVMVIGGDFMPFHRFLHPIWPVICLLFGLGLYLLEERLAKWCPSARWIWRLSAGAVLLVAVGLWSQLSFQGSERDRYLTVAQEESARATIGKWLAARYSPTDWLAVKPAGIIPYYSNMQTIDFFCLTDRKAAQTGQWVQAAWTGHQRMNAQRIHEIAPRVVILDEHLYPWESLPPPGYTDPNHGRTWLQDPRTRQYKPVRAEIQPGQWLNYFERN